MNSMLRTLAVVSATALFAPAAMAASNGGAAGGDPERGEKLFKKCAACHKVGPNAKNAAGPLLNNVIGRTAGTSEGFKYSKSMIQAGEKGLVWDETLIASFIENPKKFLQEYLDDPKAKSRMSAKVKKEGDRKDLAAFIATFSESEGQAEASQ